MMDEDTTSTSQAGADNVVGFDDFSYDDDDETQTDVPFSVGADIPSFLLGADAAPRLQRGLLTSVKKQFLATGEAFERRVANFYSGFKIASSTTRQLWLRSNDAGTLSEMVSSPQEDQTGLLSTIALLGALTNAEENGAFAAILLESLTHVQWWCVSPQSCQELFHIVAAHSGAETLGEQQRAAIASAKLDLALRGGKLSQLLQCMLSFDHERVLETLPLSGRAAEHSVSVAAASLSDFEVRELTLPPQVGLKDRLTGMRRNDMLVFISSACMFIFDQTTLVHVQPCGNMAMPRLGNRGDVLLNLKDSGVLLIRAMGRDDYNWYFSTVFTPDATSSKECPGQFSLCVAGLSLSEVRLHFAVCDSESLCCLVTSHPPQRTRGSMYVGEIPLKSLTNASLSQHAAAMQLLPIMRNPCLDTFSTRRSAFHFTNSISVSVGRVTLKDSFHPFCVEMWVYPRSVETDQTFLSIGDKRTDEVLLGLEPRGNGVQWYGGARTPRLGFSFATFTSPGKLAVLERWWHVALNFDGAQWELWLNHELVCRQPALVSPAAIADAKCVVGKSFVGMAAEVRIWQHTRTGAQLVRDSRRPLTGAEDGLCGYFPFNEGHDNVVVDYAPHHEHALLPFGEPYWCAVDAFPVSADLRNIRHIPDFVPLAWIDEADEVFFAVSPEAYTVVGTRADHTLCVFDYSRETRILGSQRTVDTGDKLLLKSVSCTEHDRLLICCAEKPQSLGNNAVRIRVWEMWTYAGQLLTPTQRMRPASKETPWTCGSAVLRRSAYHARRYLYESAFSSEEPSWGASLPPFLLDPDDDVLALLLRVAHRAMTTAVLPEQDLALADDVATLLELNLSARCKGSREKFAARVGACYESAECFLQTLELARTTAGGASTGSATDLPLRDQIAVLAAHPALSQTPSPALVRCCCQCFLKESCRIEFLENYADQQRSPTAEMVYASLVANYSSAANCREMLIALPTDRKPTLFAALFREAARQTQQCARSGRGDALESITRCLKMIAEVLLSEESAAPALTHREALLCAFSTALLSSCVAIVDGVAAALRKSPAREEELFGCLYRGPVHQVLLSFSVSLPQLPTSSLEASATLLQRCGESLLVLLDQFASSPGKRRVLYIWLGLTNSLARLGCALLETKPDGDRMASTSAPQTPAYLCLLRNGQRKPNTERDALIKSLQGGVGAISKVFDELQRRDVSALRVVRDEELRELERHVMAACCALLLPTSALREASKESLQLAFQLVLKLRPWILSKRQESREYVATVRERAAFLALFEPVTITEEADNEPTRSARPAVVEPAAGHSSRRGASGTADPNAARVAERKRWQRLFKNWKALHHLKTLMASRENMAEMNVNAEVVACFQSDVSTAEMRAVVAWRAEKARYRLVGLQLLWQLTEKASRDARVANVLHSAVAPVLCGWHYANGIEGCSVEQLARLQSVFFHLVRASLKAFANAEGTLPWERLLCAVLSCPFLRTDFRKLRRVGLTADVLRRLWSCDPFPETPFERVNGDIPSKLRTTKLVRERCASTMTIGAAGLTLRSSGGRGCCVAPCSWTAPARYSETHTCYYFEVQVIDTLPDCHVSVGIGPADYSLSQMPGSDADSFGFDGAAGSIYTNGSARAIGWMFDAGDVVGCGWNTAAGEVFWTRNGNVVFALSAALASFSSPLGPVNPLIGIKGKGSVLVNFGARMFVFSDWPSEGRSLPSQRVIPKSMQETVAARRIGWDVFRLFSTRAAMALRKAYTPAAAAMSASSLAELAQPVGSCFDALVTALAPASAAPLARSALPPQYLTALLGHLALLSKLLRGVPSEVAAQQTASTAALLEKMAARWLLTASRAAVFSEDESETVAALLSAWYDVMHLSAPASAASEGDVLARVATAPSFLSVLLRLAGSLLTSSETRMSASETRHTADTAAAAAAAGALTSCDAAHWLALSLLQRLLSEKDERGSHAWRQPLQEWLLAAFRGAGAAVSWQSGVDNGKSSSAMQDMLLGLAILGGIPRLAAPGDVVTAMLGGHVVAPVVLLRVSWSDELAEVLELAAPSSSSSRTSGAPTAPHTGSSSRRLSLQHLHATLHGGEQAPPRFPVKGNAAHLALANAVAQLAQRWMPRVTSAAGRLEPDECLLLAQLACLLTRCAERQVLPLDPALVPSLVTVANLTDEVPTDMDRVQLELVLSLWGLFQYRQRRGLPRNRSSSGGRRDVVGRPVSSSSVGTGLVRVTTPTSMELTSSSLRIRTFAEMNALVARDLLLDGSAEPMVDDGDEDDEAADEEEEAGGSERMLIGAYTQRPHFSSSTSSSTDDGGEMGDVDDCEDDDDEDESDDADSAEGRAAMDVHGDGPRQAAALMMLMMRNRRSSRASASSNSQSSLPGTQQELFDTLHFELGCVCVRSFAALGTSFTVDVVVRVTNLQLHQVLFAQLLGGTAEAEAAQVMARIVCGYLEFGLLPHFSMEASLNDLSLTGEICAFPLPEESLNTWARFTFVQASNRLLLFYDGACVGRRDLRGSGGTLFQEDFWIGGVPNRLRTTAFVGEMRNFCIYDAAVSQATMEQFRPLDVSLSAAMDTHLAVALRGTRRSLENGSRAAAAAVVEVTADGVVAYVDGSGEVVWRDIRDGPSSVQEVDFGTGSEETDLHPIGHPLPSLQYALWRQRRRLPPEHLRAACGEAYRQLAAFYGVHALLHTACRITRSPARLAEPLLQSAVDTFAGETCVLCVTRWAVSPCNETLTALLRDVWTGLYEGTGDDARRPNAPAMLEAGNRLLAALLRVAQKPVHSAVLESAHPQRPFTTVTHEVNIPAVESYTVYVDEGSVARRRQLSIWGDRGASAHVWEFVTASSLALEVRLPNFFLSIRSAADGANWGDRVSVVVGDQPQLRAMRHIRSALSAALRAEGSEAAAQSHVWSPACLAALVNVVRRNASKTRFLALTCLNDVLLFCHRIHAGPPPALALPAMHDMRRMAIQHYLRHLPSQRVAGRFIRLSVESCVMERDFAQCCDAAAERAGVPASAEATAEAQRFARQRQEQLQLHRQRDTGSDHLALQKLRNPQSLSFEWTADGLCLLSSDGAGGSVVIGLPLTAGKWYFEMRVCGVGDFVVGVVPVRLPEGREQEAPLLLSSDALRRVEPIALNGHRSIFYPGSEEQQQPLGPYGRPIWFEKDFLGFIIDVPEQRMTVMVNGEVVLHFPFGPTAADESAAAAAAAAAATASASAASVSSNSEVESDNVLPMNGGGGGSQSRRVATSRFGLPGREAATMVSAYYPYVSFEQADAVKLNFGGRYFEYDLPAGCLPLDPAKSTFGSVFPYNQMRALQDMAAHLFTGGRHPLPPFYHDEANPFADSTERVGPAHVSVHASASVQVGTDEVKNVGLDFETVQGDCAVRAGAWYYEVTLRTQGLMQVGWMEQEEQVYGNGHGVGDSSTSWAVDLFRRVMWHRGVPEPVNIQRRWAAGDVLGCAIDLAHGELGFFLNGRPITGVLALKAQSPLLETCTFQGIPLGRHYVPAVSLRSGGTISFNFGSSPFKFKPEGFSSLGVPDSWNERMNVFYNNAAASTTMRRMRVMQEIWRVLAPAHQRLNISASDGNEAGAAMTSCTPTTAAATTTTTAATATINAATAALSMEAMEAHLLPYRLIVQATDSFSSDGMKAFTKSGEEQLRDHLATYAYPRHSGGAGGLERSEELGTRSWEMFKVLKAVSNVTNALLPFLSLNTARPSLMTLLFLTIRTLLFRAVRNELVENALTVSAQSSEQVRISINRVRAHAHPHSVRASVFGQTFELLGYQQVVFKTRQRFWNTVFLGEGAEDAGGPFREHLSEMCRELMSARLPLFVPTANNVHNTGSHRDAFVPAASACTPYDLKAFEFIGMLMGGALRIEEPLDLFLPPLVWRYLCLYPITEAEVEQVDAICVQCVREFRKLPSTVGESGDSVGGDGPSDAFEAVFGEEFFVTQLSDHSTAELAEGGAQMRVTLQNCGDYAEALLHARVHEFDKQLDRMRVGLLAVVPEVAVLLLTPEELERRVCGQADYSPEELRKDATFEGISKEDRRVQLLWKALEAATPKQRRLFLRFVSGRDRLPVKLRILPLVAQGDPDTVLPRAATCFFAVELPDYSSLEVMKRKLFYSIENCADIDTDFNARIVNEDEAPQLYVGLEETQSDLIDHLNSDNT